MSPKHLFHAVIDKQHRFTCYNVTTFVCASEFSTFRFILLSLSILHVEAVESFSRAFETDGYRDLKQEVWLGYVESTLQESIGEKENASESKKKLTGW